MEKMPAKKDDVLKKLIRQELLEPTPVDFTQNVMSGLGIAPAKSTIIYEPVISKKGWFLILLVTSGIITFLFSGNGTENKNGALTFSKPVVQQFENAIAATFSGSGMIYLPMAALAVFLLFLAESFFRQSRLKTFSA